MGGIEVPINGAVRDGVEYLRVECDVGAGKNTGEKIAETFSILGVRGGGCAVKFPEEVRGGEVMEI